MARCDTSMVRATGSTATTIPSTEEVLATSGTARIATKVARQRILPRVSWIIRELTHRRGDCAGDGWNAQIRRRAWEAQFDGAGRSMNPALRRREALAAPGNPCRREKKRPSMAERAAPRLAISGGHSEAKPSCMHNSNKADKKAPCQSSEPNRPDRKSVV